MKDMIVFIPTLGRQEQQHTYNELSKEWKRKTFFVVVRSESKFFVNKYGKERVLILPKHIKGISATKQWIYDEGPKCRFMVFLDDDLKFYKRIEDGRFKKAEPSAIDNIFNLWKEWLSVEDIALVGISPKFGSNRVIGPYSENTRIFACFAFDTTIFKEEKIRFDRLQLMHDMDIALTLLEKGYRNRLSYQYCFDQRSGSVGGCSLFRTPELIRKVAFALAELHPKTVSVKAKVSKTSWEGMEKKQGIEGTVRTDVIVQWKKAYKPRKINKSGILDFTS